MFGKALAAFGERTDVHADSLPVAAAQTPTAAEPTGAMWNCGKCSNVNNAGASKCNLCASPRQAQAKSNQIIQQQEQKQQQQPMVQMPEQVHNNPMQMQQMQRQMQPPRIFQQQVPNNPMQMQPVGVAPAHPGGPEGAARARKLEAILHSNDVLQARIRELEVPAYRVPKIPRHGIRTKLGLGQPKLGLGLHASRAAQSAVVQLVQPVQPGYGVVQPGPNGVPQQPQHVQQMQRMQMQMQPQNTPASHPTGCRCGWKCRLFFSLVVIAVIILFASSPGIFSGSPTSSPSCCAKRGGGTYDRFCEALGSIGCEAVPVECRWSSSCQSSSSCCAAGGKRTYDTICKALGTSSTCTALELNRFVGSTCTWSSSCQ